MNLKMIVNNKDENFYINTDKIDAIKTFKSEYYYLIHIYIESHQIEFKFENEKDFKEVLERLGL